MTLSSSAVIYCPSLRHACWNFEQTVLGPVLSRYPQLLWAGVCISHSMSWQHFTALLPVLWALHFFLPAFVWCSSSLKGEKVGKITYFEGSAQHAESVTLWVVNNYWSLHKLLWKEASAPNIESSTWKLIGQLGNPWCFCYTLSLSPNQGWALIFVSLPLIVSPFPRDHIVRIVWCIDFSNWHCLLSNIFKSPCLFFMWEFLFSSKQLPIVWSIICLSSPRSLCCTLVWEYLIRWIPRLLPV